MIKTPNVAGQFYPDDPVELSSAIDQYLAKAMVEPFDHYVDVAIVPHAGHIYSGPVAAYSFKALSKNKYKAIIIIAPTHHYQYQGVSIWPKGGLQTPLGVVNIDEELAQQLLDATKMIFVQPQAFEREHSVEVELPFIQKVFPEAKIVPLICGRQFDVAGINELAEALVKVIGSRKDVLVLISSDMSHYHDDTTARRLDTFAYQAMEHLDRDDILTNNSKTMEVDGVFEVSTAITYAKLKKLNHSQLLKYGNSGDITGDRKAVVGYVALAMYQSDDGKDAMELTPQQKRQLINVARQTIDEFVKTGKTLEFNVDDKRLLETEGAFVTVHKDGQLRGCIGNIIGRGPLVKTVRDMAVAAVSQDPRFKPVALDELPSTEVEVSVLSAPQSIKDANQIEMGKHGVIITRGGKGGVFLPQVATETGWSREEFLSQLCSQKADLPADCWKDPSTKIEIFTAQVFSEKDI